MRWARLLLFSAFVSSCHYDRTEGSPTMDHPRSSAWIKSPKAPDAVRLRGKVHKANSGAGFITCWTSTTRYEPCVVLETKMITSPDPIQQIEEQCLALDINQAPATPAKMGAAIQQMIDSATIKWDASGLVADIRWADPRFSSDSGRVTLEGPDEFGNYRVYAGRYAPADHDP
jgi:hypothetical protein